MKTAFLLAVLILASDLPAQRSPNVILILADDMGIDAVSAFNAKLGLKTPAIDRLAREGMSFPDAHSTSGVCSPTRYAVLTGRYNWRSRLKRGIVGKWERPLIDDARLTLPEVMREQGYDTTCIGKWHLGWQWPKTGGGTTRKPAEIDFTARIPGGPVAHGFDYYFGDDVPNWPPYVWRENDKVLGQITARMKQGAMVGVSAGPAVADWDFRAVLAEYGKRVSRHIRERAKEEKPFFLYFPMPSPHTPIAPHAEFRGKTGIGEYADFLVQTDAVVGQLLNALDETKQAKETLVIFTCDNGTSPKANFAGLEKAGVHLREHWRGWKADAFEGGHRVPFIVRWPGRVKAGTRCGQTITLADIMATCADVVGHELPATAAEDSVSLLPVLRGQSTAPLHDIVVHHSSGGHFAVRKGRWKLLLCRGSGGWSPPTEQAAAKRGLPPVQLYDLEADPKETTNLFAKHPEVVKRLTADLRGVIERGRSTPGPKQENHAGGIWWNRLPWKKPERVR
ncbi:MAG: arylsulfatase [Planctomycetes bacterium]|nr:arylsulfatase [Planctomycetota bacterium]